MVMDIRDKTTSKRCRKCQLGLMLIGGAAPDMPSEQLVWIVRQLHKMSEEELWFLLAVKNRSLMLVPDSSCLDELPDE